jgi:hypothetical protein
MSQCNIKAWCHRHRGQRVHECRNCESIQVTSAGTGCVRKYCTICAYPIPWSMVSEGPRRDTAGKVVRGMIGC